MTTAPPLAEVHFRDDTLTIATWRDLYIEAWWKHGTVGHLRRVREQHDAFLRRSPGQKSAQLAVVRSNGITLESRDEMIRRYEEMLSRVSASAVVMPTSGFTSSVVRSMIAALTLLRKPPYPWKMCENVDQAGTFLAPHLKREAHESLVSVARRVTDVVAQLSAVA